MASGRKYVILNRENARLATLQPDVLPGSVASPTEKGS